MKKHLHIIRMAALSAEAIHSRDESIVILDVHDVQQNTPSSPFVIHDEAKFSCLRGVFSGD